MKKTTYPKLTQPLEKAFSPNTIANLKTRFFHGLDSFTILKYCHLSGQEEWFLYFTSLGIEEDAFHEVDISSQELNTIKNRIRAKIDRYRDHPPQKYEFDDILPICHEARDAWDRDGRLLFTEEEAKTLDQIGEQKSRRQICLALHISGQVLDERLVSIMRKQSEHQSMMKAYEEHIEQEHEDHVNPKLDFDNFFAAETAVARLGKDAELKAVFPISDLEEGEVTSGYQIVSTWTGRGQEQRSEKEMQKRAQEALDKE
jgi:hypothetical protein